MYVRAWAFVCMSDCQWHVLNNDLFKLDLDTKEWHRNGIQPQELVKPRRSHGMVFVGSDLYVFGGSVIVGRLSGCMSDRSPRGCSMRCCCAYCHMLYSSGVPCRAAPDLVTLDGTAHLSWHHESQRGRR
jgi:hypothetical protein